MHLSTQVLQSYCQTNLTINLENITPIYSLIAGATVVAAVVFGAPPKIDGNCGGVAVAVVVVAACVVVAGVVVAPNENDAKTNLI